MTQQIFVDREKELEFLEKSYTSKKPEFIILYGRRRVGKTELILKFLKKKNGIYFLSSTEGDRENISMFKAKIAEFIDDESFLNVEFKDWFSLFNSLFKNTRFLELMKKEKIVIVIDEFPFLIHSNPAIPSIFQRIWELVLKNKNIMLILCGSSVGVMEEKVVGYKSPLYGRRTGQWEVRPLSFIYIKKFFPTYSIEELAKTWFIVGGVPEYLLKFEPRLSLWQNVKENILEKGSYLYREAEVLLNQEFREPKNYKLIFKAISLGRLTLGEICNFTGLDKSMVSKYLDVLSSMHIIRGELPITASPKSKKRLYFLIDPYFNFWFRYVYPNKIDLEARRTKEVLAMIKKDFPNYCGFMFERLVRQLILERVVLTDFNPTKIGKWWYKEKEIDVIALNDQTKEVLFGECKWKEKVDVRRVLHDLKEKAKFVDWNIEKRKEYYAIFAKSFRRKIKEKNLLLFDLKDLGRIFR